MLDETHQIIDTIDRLVADLRSREVVFPTCTEVSVRVLQALNNPELNLEEVERRCVAEPLLSAKLIALANSAAMAASRPIGDVKSALVRVGLNAARAVAAALVTRQLLEAGGLRQHRRLARGLWEHTAYVAALSHVIARRMSRLSPDQAMFCGLVHNIGQFYLIARAAEEPGLLDHEHMLSRLLFSHQDSITRALLETLQVPEAILEAVSGEGTASPSVPPQTLRDVLQLARAISPLRSPLEHDSVEEWSEARDRMLEPLDIEAVAAVVNEASDDLEGILRALDA